MVVSNKPTGLLLVVEELVAPILTLVEDPWPSKLRGGVSNWVLGVSPCCVDSKSTNQAWQTSLSFFHEILTMPPGV